MKNIVAGFGFLILIILTAFITVAIEKDAVIKNTLEKSTENAVYQTLSECFDEEEVPLRTDAELAGRFKENLLIQLNQEHELNINVIAADCKKGILSVEVTEKYQNFWKGREVHVRKTAVYERTGK